MSTIKVKIRIKEEADHFSAYCQEFDIASYGDTREEAIEMIDDAIVSFLTTAPESEIKARLAAYRRRQSRRTVTNKAYSLNRSCSGSPNQENPCRDAGKHHSAVWRAA